MEAQYRSLRYLIDAFAAFVPFSRRDKIPGLPCFPAIADGTISLCGGGMKVVVLAICFAMGPFSDAHSIFKPCCCQGAASDELLFVGANMTSMRNSK